MPWNETCAMDEKLRLVAAYLNAEAPMTELCARFGISRKTGYQTLARYHAEGFDGLAPRSRAPHRHGLAMAPETAQRILTLRRERPHWGPRKLRAALLARAPQVAWPAASTIGDLLRRENLVERRGRRRRRSGERRPLAQADAANAVWCTDFKGWFRTRDNQRCDPLTVSDGFSRYVLCCRIVPPTTAGVMPVFEELFEAYGLPAVMRSDNGAPFSAPSCAGLSRLNVHWIKLGIRIELIDPGQPQQNGRHERFHRTLKAETTRPPAASPAEQQARFDAFCRDFNTQRPHEALGQALPAQHYTPSLRPHPGRLAEPWYDADHQLRKVRANGDIKWRGERVFISESLEDEAVGLAELASGDWLVRFFDYDLGVIERRTNKFRRFGPPRPGRTKADQTGNTVTHEAGS